VNFKGMISLCRFHWCSSWSHEFAMLTNWKLLCLKVTSVWALLLILLYCW